MVENKVDEGTEIKVPHEVVPLPSRGHFYPEDHPLSSGEVILKYMTAHEEDILTTRSFIQKGIVLDRLLDAVILTEGVKTDDLLVGDKNALMVMTRALGYGPIYTVQLTCPACEDQTEQDFDLRHIQPKELDFDAMERGKNEFSFTLPATGTGVTFKLLSSGDTKGVEQEIDRVKKFMKGSANPEVTTRLRYAITSVDGDTTKARINAFVNKEMLARDSRALREEIRRVSPDIDMSFNYECGNCAHADKMEMRIDARFFYPGSE